MTCRLHICFSLVALWAAAPVLLNAATLTGRVQVPGKAGSGGVALWLVPVQGRAPAPPLQMHKVTQKGKRFIPHVSVIGVGSTVDWPNQDPIFHNAFSNFAGQPFDTGLYPPGGTQKIRFQREGVVRVFCNIHSSMSAVIVVVPTPWFAASRADGTFSMNDVPPGEYTLKVWYERATEASLRRLERRLTLTEGGTVTLEPIALSDAGFVPGPPHKNKYGQEYAPEPPAKAGYESVAAARGGGGAKAK